MSVFGLVGPSVRVKLKAWAIGDLCRVEVRLDPLLFNFDNDVKATGSSAPCAFTGHLPSSLKEKLQESFDGRPSASELIEIKVVIWAGDFHARQVVSVPGVARLRQADDGDATFDLCWSLRPAELAACRGRVRIDVTGRDQDALTFDVRPLLEP